MRSTIGLALLLITGMGISIGSAQVGNPAETRIHTAAGVITNVYGSTFTVRGDNLEQRLIVDVATRIRGIGTIVNDGVLRTPRPLPLKPGDRVLVTYREDKGVLTAVEVQVAPRKSKAR